MARQFSWDAERPPLASFSARRGENIYSFVLSLKKQRSDFKLWPRQTIKLLKELVRDDAEKYLIRGIEQAIRDKTSLQDNFGEQAQRVCSMLYDFFGAPNLSLYKAAEQGAVYIVRNAVTTGNIIQFDEKGRPRMNSDDIVANLEKKASRPNKCIYDYEWGLSSTGDTALHVAALEGSHHHYQICRLLLQAGWEPTKMNYYGQTPIDKAMMSEGSQATRILELLWSYRSKDQVPLLKFGANIDHRPPAESIRYTLPMWKEVNAIFKDMIANEIVTDSDVEEDTHKVAGENSLEEDELIVDVTEKKENENLDDDAKNNDKECKATNNLNPVDENNFVKQTPPAIVYIPATEEQNLALCLAALSFKDELIKLAVEEGHEIFWHYSDFGLWSSRKVLRPIRYNRKWCDSRGMTALHFLCSRIGPVDEKLENIGIAIVRCLVNNGWDINKFTTVGDGRSVVYFAERNRLKKIASIIHTMMPAGHKSQKWRTKQTLSRTMETTMRSATKMENELLLWCSRGFVDKTNDTGTAMAALPQYSDASVDKLIFDSEKKVEDDRWSKFYADVSKGNINRSEKEKILEAEEERLQKKKDDEAMGIQAHDVETEGEKICNLLQKGQHRKQWLGHCVLAACSRGYQIFQDQGIIKCRPVQPAIDYDRDYVDENGFSALDYASLRCQRKLCMILIGAGWDPNHIIKRLGMYFNNTCATLSMRGGDKVLSEGLSLFAGAEISDFTTWISEADAREEKRRLEELALQKKLQDEKDLRVQNILSILHACGMTKSCDDEFVNRMKPDRVEELATITNDDLMKCGVTKLAARSILRKLPGALKQYQKR